jgi:hypothetical protein
MTKNMPNFAGYMQVVTELNKDKCRTCKHSRYDHATHPRKGKKPCLLVEDLNHPRFECNCKNFITSNNLEFLEMKYDQLGRKTSRKSSKNKQAK